MRPPTTSTPPPPPAGPTSAARGDPPQPRGGSELRHVSRHDALLAAVCRVDGTQAAAAAGEPTLVLAWCCVREIACYCSVVLGQQVTGDAWCAERQPAVLIVLADVRPHVPRPTRNAASASAPAVARQWARDVHPCVYGGFSVQVRGLLAAGFWRLAATAAFGCPQLLLLSTIDSSSHPTAPPAPKPNQGPVRPRLPHRVHREHRAR